eukprot:TRINITY_DN77147_c0_g1_i1.p1 TRINITY_DN77147_c0_g1~~TRINITY_DN77147_c0_g1_i1.p1  ORF type:complete len:342 (-),score=82.76 TRINITY_DN77147_c0_g1_i1:41-1066(-)
MAWQPPPPQWGGDDWGAGDGGRAGLYDWHPASRWEEPNQGDLAGAYVAFFGVLVVALPLFVWFTYQVCKEDKETPDHLEREAVEFDLLSGRVHFTDSWLKDFTFYSQNYHPLLGIFMCHPLHPYDKKERVVVLLSTTIVSTILCTLAEALMPKWAKWNRFFVTTVMINFPLLVLNAFLAWLAVVPERLRRFGTETACCKPCVKCLIPLVKLLFYGLNILLLLNMVLQVRAGLSAASDKKVNKFYQSLPSAFANVVFMWVVWFLEKMALPVFGFGPPGVPENLKCMFKWSQEEQRALGDPDPKLWAMAEERKDEEKALQGSSSSGESEMSDFSDAKLSFDKE